MPELYTLITDAVAQTLFTAGEDLDDYNVHAIIATTPLVHGAIVRDYRALRAEGYTVRGAIGMLRTKYPQYEETSIHDIIKKARRAR